MPCILVCNHAIPAAHGESSQSNNQDSDTEKDTTGDTEVNEQGDKTNNNAYINSTNGDTEINKRTTTYSDRMEETTETTTQMIRRAHNRAPDGHQR